MEEQRWSLGGFAHQIKKEDEIDFEQIVIRKKKRGWQGRNWGKKEANWMHAVAFWKVPGQNDLLFIIYNRVEWLKVIERIVSKRK